jgi:UDP-2,3-diacylglucosamine pyrophosphatase LpxH
MTDTEKKHYPVIVLSDIHLGVDDTHLGLVCDFLRHATCDKLVLNGDIIDGRHIDHRPAVDYSEAQKRVLDEINRKIRDGAEVIYVPGNHDIELRHAPYINTSFAGMSVQMNMT